MLTQAPAIRRGYVPPAVAFEIDGGDTTRGRRAKEKPRRGDSGALESLGRGMGSEGAARLPSTPLNPTAIQSFRPVSDFLITPRTSLARFRNRAPCPCLVRPRGGWGWGLGFSLGRGRGLSRFRELASRAQPPPQRECGLRHCLGRCLSRLEHAEDTRRAFDAAVPAVANPRGGGGEFWGPPLIVACLLPSLSDFLLGLPYLLLLPSRRGFFN